MNAENERDAPDWPQRTHQHENRELLALAATPTTKQADQREGGSAEIAAHVRWLMQAIQPRIAGSLIFPP